jgi:hypothetical protein
MSAGWVFSGRLESARDQTEVSSRSSSSLESMYKRLYRSFELVQLQTREHKRSYRGYCRSNRRLDHRPSELGRWHRVAKYILAGKIIINQKHENIYILFIMKYRCLAEKRTKYLNVTNLLRNEYKKISVQCTA